MGYQFDWVDAFSERPFGGNGCAVVHDAGGMADDTCLAFVRETGLVECTFLEPSGLADIKIRYFLASQEIPFAGHPTVASVASMVDRGMAGPGALTVETGAGVLPIEVAIGADGVARVTMTQIAPEFGAELAPDLVAAVGGLLPGDIAAPPQVVSTGLPFVVTVLKDHDALRRVRLDVTALQAMRAAAGGDPSAVMEPFWVVPQGAEPGGDTFARLLLAPPNPPEDPFTGSATGAMAAYLWARGLIEKPDFIAHQGHWMGRPGQARVEVLGPPDAITGVRVGGAGYVLMRGQLNI